MGKMLSFIKLQYKQIIAAIFFILLFCGIAIFSGYALYNNQLFRTAANYYFLAVSAILLIILILNFQIRKLPIKKAFLTFLNNIRKNRAVLFLLFLLFVYIFSFLLHREFSKEGLSTLAFVFCVALFAFAFTSIVKFSYFVKMYRIIFPILCAISLIVFSVSLFSTSNFSLFRFETSANYTYNNFYLLCFQITRNQKRNCGIFWEPGLFAIFVNIAFIFEFIDIKRKKPKVVSCALYLLTLISTFSTAGYIIFVVVFIYCFHKVTKTKKIELKFVLLSFLPLILVIALFFIIPSLRTKIIEQTQSYFSRLYGPIVNFHVFKKGKIFGVGLLEEQNFFNSMLVELKLTDKIDAQTSSMGVYVSSFGIFGILIYLLPLIYLGLSKKIDKFDKVLLMIVFFLFTNVEPLVNNLFFFILIFYFARDFGSGINHEHTNRNVLCFDRYHENTIVSRIYHKLFANDVKNKLLFKNILYSVAIRGLAMLLGLFTTSGYLKYFGDKSTLGVWFSILQIIVFILTFDLGIGNGLKNRLIQSFEKKDIYRGEKLISSAFISSGIISLLCIAIGILVCSFLNFNTIFNISKSIINNQSLQISMMIIVASIALQFFFKIIGNIYEALQIQSASNLFALFTNLSLFIIVNAVNVNGADNKMIFLAVTYLIVSNLPYIIGGILLFNTKLKGYKLSLKKFKMEEAKDVTSLGSKFLIIQVCLLLINSINSIILSQLYTSASVPDYSCYQKIFNIVIVVCSLMTGPIWAIIAKAKTTKDDIWIKKLSGLIKKVAIVLIVCDLLLALLLQPIFNLIFASYQITVNWVYVITFAAHSIFMVVVGFTSSICNGLELLKPQLYSSLAGVVIKGALTAVNFLVPEFKNNANYWYLVQLSSCLSLIPSVIILPIFASKRIKTLVKEREKIV